MKIRISALDKEFSKFIRNRDDWTCQRCNKKYPPPTNSLHSAHFHGRRKKSVRFEPDNACALCFFCHQYFHENPVDHVNFMQVRLGKRRYDCLLVAANVIKKPDYEAIKIWLKAMIKGQETKDEGVIYGKR